MADILDMLYRLLLLAFAVVGLGGLRVVLRERSRRRRGLL